MSDDEKEAVLTQFQMAGIESHIYGIGFVSLASNGELKWVSFKNVIKTVKEIDEQLHESLKLKDDEK